MHLRARLALLALIAVGTVAVAAPPGGAGASVAAVDEPGRVVVRNAHVSLAVGKAEGGAVVSLVEAAGGAELIARQTAPRLFTLTFSDVPATGNASRSPAATRRRLSSAPRPMVMRPRCGSSMPGWPAATSR